MLHPCANATKLSYFDGRKAGFTVFILLLFLFPAGELAGLTLHCENQKTCGSLIVSPHSEFPGGLHGGLPPPAQVQEVPGDKKSSRQNGGASCGGRWYGMEVDCAALKTKQMCNENSCGVLNVQRVSGRAIRSLCSPSAWRSARRRCRCLITRGPSTAASTWAARSTFTWFCPITASAEPRCSKAPGNTIW